MTLNTAGPGIPKAATPRQNVVSAAPMALPKPITLQDARNGVRGGEDRRRSQRVLLRVHALLHVVLAGKETQLEVMTLSVNAHGALVAAKQSLPVEMNLVLEHGSTQERTSCKVVRPPREMPEGFHIALEFTSAAPDFWKIAFPPTDWVPTDS